MADQAEDALPAKIKRYTEKKLTFHSSAANDGVRATVGWFTVDHLSSGLLTRPRADEAKAEASAQMERGRGRGRGQLFQVFWPRGRGLNETSRT